MDSETTIRELKEKIALFCDERDWNQYHNAKDLAIGIVTEAAELIDHFRFKNEKEVEELFKGKKREDIAEELSDIFYFVLRLAERYDLDLSDELAKKMKKNAEKYPIEKAKGKNLKYNELK